MSQIRRRVRVVIDGVKLEVTTSALDLKGVDPTGADMVDMLAPVYNALVRTRTPNTPHTFQEFLEGLDDIDDLEPEAVPSDLDPTHPGA